MAPNSGRNSGKKRRPGPGRPFKKNGPNGEKDPRINRSGRPKVYKEFVENMQAELEPLAIERLKAQLDDPNPFVVQGAIKEVLNRARGRAPQPITGEGGEGNAKFDVADAELLILLKKFADSPTPPPPAPAEPAAENAPMPEPEPEK